MNICRAKDGFIKLHYRMQDSDLWWDDKALVLLVRMIGFAHFEDDFTSVRFKGKQRYLKRGEFSATMRELSEAVNMPIGTLRHVLKRLETDKRVSMQTDNRKTIFCICNYAKYQDAMVKPKAQTRANSRANSRANTTEGKQNIQNIKNIDTNVSMSNSNEIDVAHMWICKLFSKDPKRFTLSAKRKQKIKARLTELGKQRFKEAFLALAASPHHRGDNERGWKVDSDPYWLLENIERAEKWANEYTDTSNPTQPEIDLTKVEIEG